MASERKGMTAALAAVGSVIAASTCCIPLGTVLAAAGTAGASAVLDTARGWLMPLSAVLIVVAFIQTYRTRPSSGKRPVAGQALLWGSAAMVAAMFVFPQQIASFVADFTRERAASTPAGQVALRRMDQAGVERLRSEFNAADDRVRVLILLSPS
jgi:hypothetical protein